MAGSKDNYMKKITMQAAAVLMAPAISGEMMPKFTGSNTKVYGGAMYLHGNQIAVNDGALYITAAGWFTNTTKERLNGLPGVHINQKAGEWYLNGENWDGSWAKVQRDGSWQYSHNPRAGVMERAAAHNYNGPQFCRVCGMTEIGAHYHE